MTYEELIEEAGAAIGIEGFTPDADGVCTLVSDIGEIVIMDCKGQKEMVLLNAPVMDVPPEADAALLAALQANKGFKDTNGATLSVDPESNRFELSQYAMLDDITPESFVAMIESFATTLVGLREKLESAQQRSGEGNDGPELSDVVSQFMRV